MTENNKNFDFRYIIGRSCNRIKDGHFVLNGIHYDLEKNNKGNNLHSGSANFNKKNYDILSFSDDYVFAKTFSKDMDGNFPGNLKFYLLRQTKKYQKNNKNYIDTILCFVGISDKDTIFNVTDHTYFNLSNEETIMNHKLKIFTDKVNLNDENGLATDNIIDVKGTSFDFTKEKTIKDIFVNQHENITLGLDHNYCFEFLNENDFNYEVYDASFINELLKNNNIVLENKKIAPLCELSYENKKLIVLSDYKNLQVYTANSRNEVDENGVLRTKHSTIALEAQFCPNAINYEKFAKPILKKDEIGFHVIIYRNVVE